MMENVQIVHPPLDEVSKKFNAVLPWRRLPWGEAPVEKTVHSGEIVKRNRYQVKDEKFEMQLLLQFPFCLLHVRQIILAQYFNG